MNVLDVMDRLVASVDDDDIELDARANLVRDGAAARNTVADLIEVATQIANWLPTTKGGINRGQNISRLVSAIKAASP